MFTGIIECLGTVTHVQSQGTSVILLIKADTDEYPVAVGGSVAVNGACLTLEQSISGIMRFSAVKETIERTTLEKASAGMRVNLERALQIGCRLDGHYVYGHIDATAPIISDREVRGSLLRTIALPATIAPYCAEKGSIAVDGISLTISKRDTTSFEISLIPHTLSTTTMPLKKPGDPVNLEADIIARYLQTLHTASAQNCFTNKEDSLLTRLERAGF